MKYKTEVKKLKNQEKWKIFSNGVNGYPNKENCVGCIRYNEIAQEYTFHQNLWQQLITEAFCHRTMNAIADTLKKLNKDNKNKR